MYDSRMRRSGLTDLVHEMDDDTKKCCADDTDGGDHRKQGVRAYQ